MTIQVTDNHPQRYTMANELHARPFPELNSPGNAVYLAFKSPKDACKRNPDLDRQHLKQLLQRYGAPLPADDVDHYHGPLGRVLLKWELHTEFVSYTLFDDDVAEAPFKGVLFDMFPNDWITEAPGKILTSVLLRLENVDSVANLEHDFDQHTHGWFVPESLAASRVLDDYAAISGDFRIDESGHVRFSVLARSDISPSRLGRIVQRILEVETYKSMAMLTLPEARKVAKRVSDLDLQLATLVQSMAEHNGSANATLDMLLKISAEIELLVSTTAFRFSAAAAYELIVHDRIEVLREQRLSGKQLFAEFMLRRFDPSMRTCRSAQQRLMDLSGRAARASNLLRTRVDVSNAAQNQKILQTMSQRVELQLRLQETVEGLSVVAISYYAINLLAYFFAPIAGYYEIDKKWLMAGLIVPVAACVLVMTHKIKKRIEKQT